MLIYTLTTPMNEITYEVKVHCVSRPEAVRVAMLLGTDVYLRPCSQEARQILEVTVSNKMCKVRPSCLLSDGKRKQLSQTSLMSSLFWFSLSDSRLSGSSTQT